MKRKLFIACLAALLLSPTGVLALLCLRGGDDDDARLVSAVRRAASLRLGPGEVEGFVGQPAIVNTSREHHVNPRTLMNVAEDETSIPFRWLLGPPPRRPAYASFSRGKHVVYWVRCRVTRDGDPRIVGIRWMEDGTVEVFSGALITRRSGD